MISYLKLGTGKESDGVFLQAQAAFEDEKDFMVRYLCERKEAITTTPSGANTGATSQGDSSGRLA